MPSKTLGLISALIVVTLIPAFGQQGPPVLPSIEGIAPAPPAEPTPPVEPKITETPLPPPVELAAPEQAPPSDVPDKPLTAEEAVGVALYHQPSIMVALAGARAAHGKRVQVKSALLPTATLQQSYANVAANTTGATGGGLPGVSANGYQLSATIRQLLFDFNRARLLARQAAMLERSANANFDRAKSDLVLQVKQAFYNHAQSLRLVEVNESNVKNSQTHLDLARARLKSGLGFPLDVVRAQTAIANAIQNLTIARTAGSISRVNLASLMGIDPRTPLEIAQSGEPELAADDLAGLVSTALDSRPEMFQALANAKAAGYAVNSARKGDWPSLGLTGGWQQSSANFPPKGGTLIIGAAIQWTPFDGLLTKGRVQEMQANLQVAVAQMESTKLAVVSDVSQAYLNLKTAEQRVVTADAEVANAEESLRLAQGRYRSGLGAFLDILDAETALVTANTSRVNARSAVDQARAALVHAVNGDLKKGDRG